MRPLPSVAVAVTVPATAPPRPCVSAAATAVVEGLLAPPGPVRLPQVNVPSVP